MSEPLDTLAAYFSRQAMVRLREYRRLGEASHLGRQVQAELDKLEHAEVELVFHFHQHYPKLLLQISDPPPLLYLQGASDCLNLPQIAIVGSRHASAGGLDNAQGFAKVLADAGFVIGSGLALGIDAAAHCGALAVEGKTLAVLGTGIDKLYPARHKQLAADIVASGGALVTEFHLGVEPMAKNFPRRNRIITGMAMGTLVVEAAVRSGSLISARLALEQNREVYAIPGSIHNPLSKGCHLLIKEGAHLVEEAADIVKQLQGPLAFQGELCLAEQESENNTLEPAAKDLLEQLGYDPCNFDQLLERSGLSVGELNNQLLELELAGLVRTQAGVYQRRKA
ncbi:MAG: DNA-processing protein DprA [Cellvibrionaceae bacterium]|nr:DNA-processing protein DprA [Cellvibrionaceae bacterium]MCV6626972.1 DNA-processing protein DprA [Cellvibrionaceae bacterium]